MLWPLLTTELADYPGRLSLTARMVVSCTLVMIIIMVFRIPNAALGAYLPLLFPRDSLRTTWRAASVTIAVCIAGTGALLLGAMLFAASPMLHFFWSIGSIFAVFYLMSAMTVSSAAIGFGLLAVNGLSIWDATLPANARVTLTLYMLWSVLIGCAVTAIVEVLFAHTHPSETIGAGLRERLSVVRTLFRTYANGDQPSSLLRHHLRQYLYRGNGHLHEILLRSSYDEPYRDQLNTALSLSRELVELAVNLGEFEQHPSPEDRRRLAAVAAVLAQVDSHLGKQETPDRVELPDSFFISQTMPSLGEIERNVDLIADVFSEGSAGPLLPQSSIAASRVFVEDAFSSKRHLLIAFRGTLAASLCYIAYLSVGWKGLNASVITCFLTSLSSIGISRQKQLLRLLGTLAGGCVLGIGSQAFLLPHIDTLPEFAVIFSACMFLCCWVATSSPRLAYGGLQMALAYNLVNLNGFAINTSLVSARDALLGIVLGLVAMWAIYDHLWATTSTAALRKLFIHNLRCMAGIGMDGNARHIAHVREQIARNFEDMQSFADSLFHEPHVKDEQERSVVNRIRHWQPELRALSLVQFGLLQQFAKEGVHSSLSEAAYREVSSTLDGIAAMLEGGKNDLHQRNVFPKILSAIEQVPETEGTNEQVHLEIRLSHSLLVLAKDLRERSLRMVEGQVEVGR